MAASLLPIFPLPLVLLPATAVPLHIFEDRYKEMMNDVMGAKSEFGVVLASDDGIVNIGCTATVERVLKQYPDGRLDLIAVGRRRFQIETLNEEKPYLRAEVELFDDGMDEPVSRDLRAMAIAAVEKLRTIETPDVVVEPVTDSPEISFQLAQFVEDVKKRQALLGMRSESERLRFLVAVLPEYTAQRLRVAEAKRLAPMNGHAKHVQEG